MRVGVPREIKTHEYRVGLTPASVYELVQQGHEVWVESGAGAAIGFDNASYQQAGAAVKTQVEEVFSADLIVKVKEPQPDECRRLRPGQTLFTYLHLAADAEQARLLQQSGATCIAYETVTDAVGRLPLLAPMSEVAGRLSVQAGAHHLELAQGGRGVLLGGVPGVEPGRVLILGGGVVGDNAAFVARGMGAQVIILDRSVSRLRELDNKYQGRVQCLFSSSAEINQQVKEADLVIGAVLIPGAAAPKLLQREHLSSMKKGAVIVDVAIDQGGCFATSQPTTHSQPTFEVDGVIHYCVANMPGAVARTSTMALNNATLPYVLALATDPLVALKRDAGLRAGLNVYDGQITCKPVADSLGLEFTDPMAFLK